MSTGGYIIKKILPLLLIFLLTIIIYGDSLNNDFVDLDDTTYIHKYTYMYRLTWSALKELFNPGCVIAQGNTYTPVSGIPVLVDYVIWKLNPFGFHLTSLIFYIINLLLIYIIIIELFKDRYISLITVLIFAVNPLHVEPVAWISGRIHLTLSIFCFLSFYFFIIASRGCFYLYFFLSLFCFILAILTHPLGFMVPLVFILYLYCFPSKLREKNIFYKIISLTPFFLSVIILEVSLVLMNAQGVRLKMIKEASSYNNIYVAIIVFGKYVRLLLWPDKLSPMYNIEIDKNFILSLIILLAVTGVFIYSSIKSRELFFSIGFFLIFYVPVSQILIILPFNMADRYLYLPSLGIFLWITLLLYKVLKHHRCHRLIKISLIVCMIVIIAAQSVVTWRRTFAWQDTMTLWNDILSKYPVSMVYLRRGTIYYYRGEYDKAIADFNGSLTADPLYVEAYDIRGATYIKKNEYNLAMADFTEALRINPNYVSSYNNRGYIYMVRGEYNKAIDDFTVALTLDPNYINAYNNRGVVYNKTGDYNKAMNDFTHVIKIDPLNVIAYNNRAFAYYMKKEYNLAWKDIEKINELGYQADPTLLESLKKAN